MSTLSRDIRPKITSLEEGFDVPETLSNLLYNGSD